MLEDFSNVGAVMLSLYNSGWYSTGSTPVEHMLNFIGWLSPK